MSAAQLSRPLVDARADAIVVDNVRIEREAQHFDVVTPHARYSIETRMLGSFQRRNAATAIATLEELPEGLRPSPAQIESALAELLIPGRMEVYPGHPTLVFDIAHNVEKAEQLVASLRDPRAASVWSASSASSWAMIDRVRAHLSMAVF